jgi:hypothetical protein
MDILRLLRLGGSAKRDEHSANSKTKDSLASRTNPKSKIQNPKSLHLITVSARSSTLGGIFLF